MPDKTPGALLTPSMRKFYRDKDPASETGSRSRSIRQRTRQRLVAALYDMKLLGSKLTEEDRRAVIDEFNASELDDCLEAFIMLFAEDIPWDRWEGIVKRAVQQVVVSNGYPEAEVSVSIYIDRHPIKPSEVVRKLAAGEDLSVEEMKMITLTSPDELTDEEIQVLVDAEYDILASEGKRLEEGREWGERSDG